MFISGVILTSFGVYSTSGIGQIFFDAALIEKLNGVCKNLSGRSKMFYVKSFSPSKISVPRIIWLPLVVLVIGSVLSSAGYFFVLRLRRLQTEVEEVAKKIDEQEETFKKSLYEEHLASTEQLKVEAQLANLEDELSDLEAEEENQEYQKLNSIYDLYASLNSKLDRNQEVELDVSSYSERLTALGNMLLEKDLDELETELESLAVALDQDYENYLATLPTPEPPPANVEGYSYTTVNTERGQFGVRLIKIPLSDVRVVTSAASDSDCDNNCPVKSLEQHVRDNGGFAGINGPYFCPPDYDQCAGKVNSTDFAFYNSKNGQWLNEDALTWNKTGLATFTGHSAEFYRKSSDYGGGSVNAGVSNYPALLSEGNVVVDKGDLTSYQTDIRGPRGAIGVDDNNLYLSIVSGATVPEAAYAMKALGAEDALNLDGGGSSALYINGAYVVGPGRQLPNAIVLTK